MTNDTPNINNLTVKRSVLDVSFDEVADLLLSVEIGDFTAEKRQQTFTGSNLVIFVYDNANACDSASDIVCGNLRLIGTGRAITDGCAEGSIYDVAVAKDWQGKGVGKLMIETLLADMPNQNVILFAAPGKEEFYAKLGAVRLKTGMGWFARPERMRVRGYI